MQFLITFRKESIPKLDLAPMIWRMYCSKGCLVELQSSRNQYQDVLMYYTFHCPPSDSIYPIYSITIMVGTQGRGLCCTRNTCHQVELHGKFSR